MNKCVCVLLGRRTPIANIANPLYLDGEYCQLYKRPLGCFYRYCPNPGSLHALYI